MANMKVLLVRPPSIMKQEHSHALQHPINLCLLAAAVRQDGFAPEIIDLESEPLSHRDFARRISSSNAKVIGFTAMTPTVDAAAELAAIAKQSLPHAITALGGAHASILARETLIKYPQFNAAVRGEGEISFVEICRAVEQGRFADSEIAGTVLSSGGDILDGGTPQKPVDLENLPLPARDLLLMRSYRGAPTPGLPGGVYNATQLFTSRGCAGRCVFCCSEHVFGRKVRHRPTHKVMEEALDCVERHGVNHFTIDNDTFTHDRQKALEFCEGIKRLDVTWDCDTRVDRVDEELLRIMADSGCVKVAFGVETGSPSILELIKKGITLEQATRAFEWTRKAGMMSCAFFMVGNHPEETESDIEATRSFIRVLDPDLITVAIASPYPGSELNLMMKEAGLLEDNLKWSDYGRSFQGDSITRTKTVSAQRLQELQSRILREFYMRPSYILRRLGRLKNPREAAYWFKAGLQFAGYIVKRKKHNG